MRTIILSIVLIVLLIHASTQKVFCQNKKQLIDPFSIASYHVEMIGYNKTIIGCATGFFLVVKSKYYFITNNHVVGDEFYKQEFKSGIIPDSMIVKSLRIRLYNNKINSVFNITLPLFKGKDTLYTRFWEDGKRKNLMDVVAIPISDAIKIQLQVPVLGNENISKDLSLAPSTDLFIVGFPYDYWKQSVYPIWKRGTIASEPNLDTLKIYSFLIDATTRQGMSGSPVFYRGGMYNTSNGTVFSQANTTYLVGIYSAQNPYMEIGKVWKISKIVIDLMATNQ